MPSSSLPNRRSVEPFPEEAESGAIEVARAYTSTPEGARAVSPGAIWPLPTSVARTDSAFSRARTRHGETGPIIRQEVFHARVAFATGGSSLGHGDGRSRSYQWLTAEV